MTTRIQPMTLSTHLRGHVLLFDGRAAPAYDARHGNRLLFAAALLEVARLALRTWHPSLLPLWVLLPLLAVLSVLAVRVIAGLQPSQIGLVPWRDWSLTEKSYTVVTSLIAIAVFSIMIGAAVSRRVAADGAGVLATVFVPYLFYGFYQEVVYRGMLQRELVRRWGAIAGILVANVIFTFGPLHAYHFSSPSSAAAPMFTSIFVMGLFFGLVYHRSGNLWIAGIFHAIGNAFMITSLGMR